MHLRLLYHILVAHSLGLSIALIIYQVCGKDWLVAKLLDVYCVARILSFFRTLVFDIWALLYCELTLELLLVIRIETKLMLVLLLLPPHDAYLFMGYRLFRITANTIQSLFDFQLILE